MAEWGLVNQSIKECLVSPDPVSWLQRLFSQTHDGHVAFALGNQEERRGHLELAVDWYRQAEHLYPKPDFKARARRAYERLCGATPPLAIRRQPGADARLVIVACSRRKIWDAGAEIRPFVPASEAYQGDEVRAWLGISGNEGHERWLFLSAKYGFLEPDHPIGDYDVTFGDRATGPISDDALVAQVAFQVRWADKKPLREFRFVEVIGGQDYLRKVKLAYAGQGAQVVRGPHSEERA